MRSFSLSFKYILSFTGAVLVLNIFCLFQALQMAVAKFPSPTTGVIVVDNHDESGDDDRYNHGLNENDDDANYEERVMMMIFWEGEQAAQHWRWRLPTWPPPGQPAAPGAARSSGRGLPLADGFISFGRSS